MQNFKFSIPTTVFFGKSEIRVLGKETAKLGVKRVLLCFGSNRIKQSGLYDEAKKLLHTEGIESIDLSGIDPNPRITSVWSGVELCRKNDLEAVIAIGGGSVIDCAKAIAAGACYAGDPWDLYTGKGQTEKALPVCTVLTLAATGTEMNGTSIISNLETGHKLGLRNPILKPRFSILDPEYTYTVPRYHTAAGTVDIMSHVYEQYFSVVPGTFVADRMCEAILLSCMEYGPKALEEPNNYEARANLLWAGTIALNELLVYGRIGDWATHMIEHVVSAVYDVTHGAGLAILFPVWMEQVLSSDTVDKFYELAVRVWGVAPNDDKMNAAREGIVRTRAFFVSLGMPQKLREVGVEKKQLSDMARTTVEFGSVGRFKKLGYDEVLKILEAAW